MNILITGQNSYISTHLKVWISNANPDFFVVLQSVKETLPTVLELASFDVVIHNAALVHKKEHPSMEEEYFKINTEMTQQLARWSKEAGVQHFIFLSTMAVYGAKDRLNHPMRIEQNTPMMPFTLYGKSKLLAEKKIQELENDHFIISIVRPPMVYGQNCPGNYMRLQRLSKKIKVFPFVQNERSMIHIDNLCELLRLIVIHKKQGVFHPQNKVYINTSRMVYEMGIQNQNRIFLSKFLGVFMCCIPLSIVKKVFGNLAYEFSLSDHFEYKYVIYEECYDQSKKH